MTNLFDDFIGIASLEELEFILKTANKKTTSVSIKDAIKIAEIVYNEFEEYGVDINDSDLDKLAEITFLFLKESALIQKEQKDLIIPLIKGAFFEPEWASYVDIKEKLTQMVSNISTDELKEYVSKLENFKERISSINLNKADNHEASNPNSQIHSEYVSQFIELKQQFPRLTLDYEIPQEKNLRDTKSVIAAVNVAYDQILKKKHLYYEKAKDLRNQIDYIRKDVAFTHFYIDPTLKIQKGEPPAGGPFTFNRNSNIDNLLNQKLAANDETTYDTETLSYNSIAHDEGMKYFGDTQFSLFNKLDPTLQNIIRKTDVNLADSGSLEKTWKQLFPNEFNEYAATLIKNIFEFSDEAFINQSRYSYYVYLIDKEKSILENAIKQHNTYQQITSKNKISNFEIKQTNYYNKLTEAQANLSKIETDLNRSKELNEEVKKIALGSLQTQKNIRENMFSNRSGELDKLQKKYDEAVAYHNHYIKMSKYFTKSQAFPLLRSIVSGLNVIRAGVHMVNGKKVPITSVDQVDFSAAEELARDPGASDRFYSLLDTITSLKPDDALIFNNSSDTLTVNEIEVNEENIEADLIKPKIRMNPKNPNHFYTTDISVLQNIQNIALEKINSVLNNLSNMDEKKSAMGAFFTKKFSQIESSYDNYSKNLENLLNESGLVTTQDSNNNLQFNEFYEKADKGIETKDINQELIPEEVTKKTELYKTYSTFKKILKTFSDTLSGLITEVSPDIEQKDQTPDRQSIDAYIKEFAQFYYSSSAKSLWVFADNEDFYYYRGQNESISYMLEHAEDFPIETETGSVVYVKNKPKVEYIEDRTSSDTYFGLLNNWRSKVNAYYSKLTNYIKDSTATTKKDIGFEYAENSYTTDFNEIKGAISFIYNKINSALSIDVDKSKIADVIRLQKEIDKYKIEVEQKLNAPASTSFISDIEQLYKSQNDEYLKLYDKVITNLTAVQGQQYSKMMIPYLQKFLGAISSDPKNYEQTKNWVLDRLAGIEQRIDKQVSLLTNDFTGLSNESKMELGDLEVKLQSITENDIKKLANDLNSKLKQIYRSQKNDSSFSINQQDKMQFIYKTIVERFLGLSAEAFNSKKIPNFPLLK
jgi:predicted nuclease with TOPRIM domain